MKNIILSAVTVVAMSSFAVAGGDITPIEEPAVVTPEVMDAESGLYLGLGYGILSGDEVYTKGNLTVEVESRDFDQLLVQAGFKINSYVAVEARYWAGMNDLDGMGYHEGYLYSETASLDAFGIYVKPMYPVTPELNVYALIGYASTSLEYEYKVGNLVVTPEGIDLDGLSWGIGASFAFNESLSIFADYVVLYDDTYEEYTDVSETSEFTIDTINIGVSYKF